MATPFPVIRPITLIVIKQPIGVTAVITPWNFPAAMITRKAGPALGGIRTHGADSPVMLALALAELAIRRALRLACFATWSPVRRARWVMNVPATRWCELSFTGSTELLPVNGTVRERHQKVSLELGGNAPFIVFDDADSDKPWKARWPRNSATPGKPALRDPLTDVQDGVYDRLPNLQQAVSKLHIGDGLDKGVTIRPLIDEKSGSKSGKSILPMRWRKVRVWFAAQKRMNAAATSSSQPLRWMVPANAKCRK
ncbi:aldehyde dehydrogenase family protein [Escherichia coli]